MSLLPPKWPISTPITKAPASLWDKCIVAIPMWQTVPRNVVEGAFTTRHGAPALVPTPRGYGLDFNGVNQGLSFPAAFTSSKISVSFMFRRMVAPTDTRVLFELTSNFNGTDRTFSIFLLSTGLIRLSIHDVSANYRQSDYALPPVGEMAFCTATFEHNQSGNTGTVRLWVNGVESVGPVVKNDTFAQNGPFTTSTVYIAARAGNMLEAQVQMSSVIVHDRLLADAEIKLLHADPFQMFAPDMGAFAAIFASAAGGPAPITGAGSATSPAAQAFGAGRRVAPAAGTSQATAATAQGIGARAASATGAAIPPPAAGIGTAGRAASGIGAASSTPSTAEGTGGRAASASGASTAPAAIGTGGTGALQNGAALAPAAVASGVASRSAAASGGSGPSAASATGAGRRVAGASGAALAAVPTAQGSGARAAIGAGATIIAFPIGAGAARRIASAGGAGVAPAAVASGGESAVPTVEIELPLVWRAGPEVPLAWQDPELPLKWRVVA